MRKHGAPYVPKPRPQKPSSVVKSDAARSSADAAAQKADDDYEPDISEGVGAQRNSL